MAVRSVAFADRIRSRPGAGGGGDRSTNAECRCQDDAVALLAASGASRFGEISSSIYETARLVAQASWLPGHRSRIEYLLATQRRDGGWGGPAAYGLVPTLSAIDALLTTVLHPPPKLPSTLRMRSVAAADAGLAHAHRALGATRSVELPDTPAIEVIIPFLVARLRRHLGELRHRDEPGLDQWRGRVRLPLPKGLTDRALRAVRSQLADGGPTALKVMHSLEVVDELAAGLRGVPRTTLGTVGASPAATAAWLGAAPRDPAAPAARYLRAVIAKHGGPVPSVVPITNFERSWVVTNLALGGLATPGSRRMVAQMLAALRPRGVAGGVGLPPDADTTSTTLVALRHLGAPVRDTVLRQYDQGTHFCTWPGERTPSPTTNAHVLAALAAHRGRRDAWRASAIDRAASWLRDSQHRDGWWSDKWHASPFYATSCAVVALRDAFGDADPAVGRAVAWVLDSQRRDGSWGHWTGTAEETAYALQILLYRAGLDRRTRAAATRGYRFLCAAESLEPTPLWHDKDLYLPAHVVRSAVIGARHLAETALGQRTLS